MNFVKLFFGSMAVAGLLDLAWMGLVAGNFYKSRLSTLLRPGRELAQNHWLAIFWIYVAIAAGIVLFVLPRVTTATEAALFGAGFGLILYGVYELTNYALLSGWPVSILIVDTLWGAALCGITSLIAFYLQK